MAAVSGANGSVLWERPVAQDVALAKCAVPPQSDSEAASACILVGSLGSSVAVNLFTGQPSGKGRWFSLEGSALALPWGLLAG